MFPLLQRSGTTENWQRLGGHLQLPSESGQNRHSNNFENGETSSHGECCGNEKPHAMLPGRPVPLAPSPPLPPPPTSITSTSASKGDVVEKPTLVVFSALLPLDDFVGIPWPTDSSNDKSGSEQCDEMCVRIHKYSDDTVFLRRIDCPDLK
ncbi:unnamed protein product [Protopolystoma xenopodis]|uniref:Uncharacterized protein n=1 Tax=Protopolystoma xenopodis TaxID=117903 RepID=A0A448WEA6_9PLAT|nr:unnamed protein product [Protopolystoma xenopodis]